MISYRGKTFCRGDGCAKFGTCHRSLTDEVRDKARKWWGSESGEAPISEFADPREVDCWESETQENLSNE